MNKRTIARQAGWGLFYAAVWGFSIFGLASGHTAPWAIGIATSFAVFMAYHQGYINGRIDEFKEYVSKQ